MRRRILLLVVGMTTLVVLAFAIPLAILVRHNAYDAGVSDLRAEATGLFAFLRGSQSRTGRTPAQISAQLAKLDDDRAASVQLADGTILGDRPPGDPGSWPAADQQGRFGDRPSDSPTRTAGPSDSPTRGARPQGGGDPAGFGRDLDARDWADGKLVTLSVPTLTGFGQTGTQAQFYTVRVYASDGELHSGDTGQLILIIGVAVALLVVGVAAGEVLTRRIVRPLVDTAGTAQRLSTGDTTARAPTTGPPEVAGVGLALNRLADRIDQLIAEERETVADMSHRLRTPLTALRLDAEALSSTADAERIGAHVGTLERMLTAVIRAARRPQREGRIPSCDATSVVGERVEFWSALTEDQERVSTVALPSDAVPVRAGAEDLAAAVDALLENVVGHTPEGTAFGVTLEATASGARLTVSDDGPGLPADASVRGRSDRGSTGLGLDIARRCAESSGGSMALASSPSGGALIVLELGRP